MTDNENSAATETGPQWVSDFTEAMNALFMLGRTAAKDPSQDITTQTESTSTIKVDYSIPSEIKLDHSVPTIPRMKIDVQDFVRDSVDPRPDSDVDVDFALKEIPSNETKVPDPTEFIVCSAPRKVFITNTGRKVALTLEHISSIEEVHFFGVGDTKKEMIRVSVSGGMQYLFDGSEMNLVLNWYFGMKRSRNFLFN